MKRTPQNFDRFGQSSATTDAIDWNDIKVQRQFRTTGQLLLTGYIFTFIAMILSIAGGIVLFITTLDILKVQGSPIMIFLFRALIFILTIVGMPYIYWGIQSFIFDRVIKVESIVNTAYGQLVQNMTEQSWIKVNKITRWVLWVAIISNLIMIVGYGVSIFELLVSRNDIAAFIANGGTYLIVAGVKITLGAIISFSLQSIAGGTISYYTQKYFERKDKEE